MWLVLRMKLMPWEGHLGCVDDRAATCGLEADWTGIPRNQEYAGRGLRLVERVRSVESKQNAGLVYTPCWGLSIVWDGYSRRYPRFAVRVSQ